MEAVIYRSTKRILHCKVQIFPPTELAHPRMVTFSIGIFPGEHEMQKWKRDFTSCLTHNSMELLSSEAREVWPIATPHVDFDQSAPDGVPWEVVPVLPTLALKRLTEKAWRRTAHST